MKILMTKKGSMFLSKYLVHSFVFTISLLGPSIMTMEPKKVGECW